MADLPMTNLSHPNGVSRQFYNLMQEIEKLPASDQQTKCCIKTSEVQAHVLAEVTALQSRVKELEEQGKQVLLSCELREEESENLIGTIWSEEEFYGAVSDARDLGCQVELRLVLGKRIHIKQ